jgi:L1 cell adhesion molecule like protein
MTKPTLKKQSKIQLAGLMQIPAAEKEEYEEKQKALEGIAMPILQNMAGGGMPAGGMPDMGGAPPSSDPASGPTIEEID